MAGAIVGTSSSYKVFQVFVYLFLGFLAVLCIIPMINILAISFSDQGEVARGNVFFWPKGFTFDSYRVIFGENAFVSAFYISVQRVVAGTALNVVLTLLLAYPLSKTAKLMPGRNLAMWSLVFVMLFNGGLVPTYMLVRGLGLIDSFWALILPTAVPLFSVVLIMNFIRNLPKSLEEAALIDGAGYFQVLYIIIVPLTAPAIATITLFSAVGQWNEYFMGLIYMNRSSNYPLQTYLYTMSAQRDINNLDQALAFARVSDRTLISAQLFVAMIPILVVYPFLQRHFVKGIVLGSVKE
jgi:putative aldouronate transport system permease protein